MERRKLLKVGLGSAATAAALPLATPALAQNAGGIFKLVTDREAEGQALAQQMSVATGGRFTTELSTVSDADRGTLIAQVGAGDADMYLSSEDAFTATDPGFGLFAAMPQGMSPSEFEGWLYASDGQQLWDEMSAEQGIKAFAAGDDGPHALWSKAPIPDMGALTSGTIGSTGLGVSNLSKMGANAVDLFAAGTDVGGLSALEGLSLTQMVDTGLLDVFPHMTTPNGNRPMAGRSVGMTLARWSALSEDDQLLMTRIFASHHGLTRFEAMHRTAEAVAANGTRIVAGTMPDDVWAAQISAANATMIDLLDADAIRADAADAYLYFLADVAGWSEIGEAAFFLGRNRALTASL